jgi:hypothetical protein
MKPMIALTFAGIFALTSSSIAAESHPNKAAIQHHSIRLALLCFLKGEQQAGLNKICFYDCAGSGTAITIKSYQLCPINIDR